MKRRILLDLWKVLTKLEFLKHDVRFSYFIVKNKRAIKEEMQILNESQKPSNDFIEYDNIRVELAKKYSDKDEIGNPKVLNEQFVITENMYNFDMEMRKLKERFKDTITAREQQLKDYNDLLEEDIDFKLTKVKLECLPKQIEPLFLEVFIEAGVIDED